MEKEKLTVNEAAEYLETTRQKISRLIARGVLTAEKNPYDPRFKLIPIEQLQKLRQAKEEVDPKIEGVTVTKAA